MFPKPLPRLREWAGLGGEFETEFDTLLGAPQRLLPQWNCSARGAGSRGHSADNQLVRITDR
jgi:hypothetical protein